jgi:hypothetical protein
VAGALWLISFGLLVAGLMSRPGRRDSWAIALLTVYAVAMLFVQPSIRADGNKEAAVITSAVWLIPAAAGGVALPRAGRWAAAAGCWCLLLALSAAAAGTVSHRSSFIGFFGVLWD